MSRKMVRFGAVLLVVLFAFGAFAGEGRIPIYQYPTTITASGKYVLTRNLGPAPSGTILIDVQASEVEIDLNGFSLTHTGSPGTAIQVMNQEAVVIRNGTIRRGQIHVADSKKIVLEDLLIDEVHDDVILFENVTSFAIRRVHVLNGGMAAVRVNNAMGVFSEGVIEDNLFESCGEGIRVQQGGSMEISHNRIDRTTSGASIYLMDSHGCLLAENTIYSSAQDGIRVENSFACKLYDNIVHDVSGAGIALVATSDSLVLNNVVSEANSDGIFVDGARVQVDRNVTGSNYQFGLHFGTSSVDCSYGRNMARGNVGGPCANPSSTPEFCDEGGANTSFGDNFLPSLM